MGHSSARTKPRKSFNICFMCETEKKVRRITVMVDNKWKNRVYFYVCENCEKERKRD